MDPLVSFQNSIIRASQLTGKNITIYDILPSGSVMAWMPTQEMPTIPNGWAPLDASPYLVGFEKISNNTEETIGPKCLPSNVQVQYNVSVATNVALPAPTPPIAQNVLYQPAGYQNTTLELTKNATTPFVPKSVYVMYIKKR